MYLFYMYVLSVCTLCVPGACGAQKRVLDPLALKLQMMCHHLWYWEPKLGPLQEPKALVTMETSLQSQGC